jgi:hypothetical protein
MNKNKNNLKFLMRFLTKDIGRICRLKPLFLVRVRYFLFLICLQKINKDILLNIITFKKSNKRLTMKMNKMCIF